VPGVSARRQGRDQRGVGDGAPVSHAARRSPGDRLTAARPSLGSAAVDTSRTKAVSWLQGFGLGDSSMNWQAPAFEEINMSAEIGAYQGDEEGDPLPFVSSPEGASKSEA